jgi:DNA polymerase III epsilon subunit-like protein
MKIFFDTEFTGLHQHTSLISIGFVTEDNRSFYAELSDYKKSQLTDWHRANVITYLKSGKTNAQGQDWYVHGTRRSVTKHLTAWFSQFDAVELWADVLAYDWVLFCELFGGAFGIPKNIHYQPFDVATLLKLIGENPDVNREQYANLPDGEKHNALWDAQVTKAVYDRAIKNK